MFPPRRMQSFISSTTFSREEYGRSFRLQRFPAKNTAIRFIWYVLKLNALSVATRRATLVRPHRFGIRNIHSRCGRSWFKRRGGSILLRTMPGNTAPGSLVGFPRETGYASRRLMLWHDAGEHYPGFVYRVPERNGLRLPAAYVVARCRGTLPRVRLSGSRVKRATPPGGLCCDTMPGNTSPGSFVGARSETGHAFRIDRKRERAGWHGLADGSSDGLITARENVF